MQKITLILRLLNVYDVKPLSGEINVNLSSDELGGHRVGNDYIYEYIFKQGYHGGAIDGPEHPAPGTPYWRTGFNFSEWGRPAPKTTSAYMLMQKYISEKKDPIKELTWSTFIGYLKWYFTSVRHSRNDYAPHIILCVVGRV